MNNIVTTNNKILPMSKSSIEKVDKLTAECLKHTQAEIDILHIIHGGVYARTVKILKGTIITGAFVKRATILIIQGSVVVYMNDAPTELHGYNVFAASANRKQAFVALSDVYLTMLVRTDKKDVKEVEEELTDEAAYLLSRIQDNATTIIT